MVLLGEHYIRAGSSPQVGRELRVFRIRRNSSDGAQQRKSLCSQTLLPAVLGQLHENLVEAFGVALKAKFGIGQASSDLREHGSGKRCFVDAFRQQVGEGTRIIDWEEPCWNIETLTQQLGGRIAGRQDRLAEIPSLDHAKGAVVKPGGVHDHSTTLIEVKELAVIDVAEKDDVAAFLQLEIAHQGAHVAPVRFI